MSAMLNAEASPAVSAQDGFDDPAPDFSAGWDEAMTAGETAAPSAGTLVLDARPLAADVHQALGLQIATQDAPLILDASAVERLPTPVMQVLLAAILELDARGQRMVVRNPSFAFGLAFEALGFGGEREVFTVEYC